MACKTRWADQPYQSTTEAAGTPLLPVPEALHWKESAPEAKHLQGNDPSTGCTKKPVEQCSTLMKLAKRPSVDIEFHDLSYSVRNRGTTRGRKQILKNLNGKFRSGELTAILGPSGAGKSSLLNILVGYVSAGVTGEIKTNGHPRQMPLFHKLSTYIQQDDLLQPRLTVDEAMKVAADLKLGHELTPVQKGLVVDEILITLGLTVCRNTLAEKLSGGQRKRLSVALELVNNPPIIFLDEPTTGLDIVSIKQLITLLKVLAGQGRTIVCTIHQPNASLFKLFDQVYTVAKGLCVYNGVTSQLVPHLSSVGFDCPIHYNPADYVMELIQSECGENIKILAAEIQNGKINKKCEAGVQLNGSKYSTSFDASLGYAKNGVDGSKISVEFPTSFVTQLKILMCRMILQMSRNKTTLWIQFLHHFLSALILGGIYFDTGDQADKPYMNFKFSLSVLVFFMYTYIMTPVLLFPNEVKLLKREYFNRWYGLKSYFLAITIVNIPIMIIFGLLFLSVSYLLSNQPLDAARFARLAAIGILTGAASEAFGMVVGSLFNIVNGSIVAPASVSPLLALAAYGMGHGMTIEPIMNFLMSLSYLRYGLVGISTALYGHDRPHMHCVMPENVYCHYQDPALLLRDLGMEGLTTNGQITALVIFYLMYRFMAYLALRYRLTTEFSGKILDYVAKILRQK